MIMSNAKIPMTNQVQNPNDKNSSPSGFSALLTVLIIGVAALAMAYSSSMLGLGELDLGYTAQKGGEAFSAADGCLEEAMRRLRLNTGYTGGNLPIGANSCTITVNGLGGNQYEVIVLGESSGYYKKIRATVAVTPEPPSNLNVVTINSWEERSD